MCGLTNSIIKIKRDLTSKPIKVKYFSTLFEMFSNFEFETKNSSLWNFFEF